MTNKNIRNFTFIVIMLVIIIWPLVQKRFQKQTIPTTSPIVQIESSPSAVPILGVNTAERTKISGCIINDKLPDPLCSPGAIFPEVTAKEICVSGYSKNVRNVSESEKNEV